jgi:hypothetical protein
MSWNKDKSADLEICRLLFEIADIGIDYLLDYPDPQLEAGVATVVRKIQDDAREIERHYTADRKWVGNNGGHRRR